MTNKKHNADGYVVTGFYDRRGRPITEHRLIAEKTKGGPLAKGAVVHHINENRADNRPENLMIFKSSQAHTIFHAKQRERTNVKKINKGLGSRVKKIRVANELTQAEFGEIVGVTQRYIGMMEQGIRKPSKGLIIAICSRFNEDEGWLCSGRKPAF